MAENTKTALLDLPKGTLDFSGWNCPLPLVGYPTIVMGHGGGGKLGNELVEHLFLPAFRNPALENLGDAAVLNLPNGRLAMSTDSFVVQPLFFPGGSIGELAVNGTVNDIAVSVAALDDLGVSGNNLHASRGRGIGHGLDNRCQLCQVKSLFENEAGAENLRLCAGDG